jgi:hypothetical protein
MAGNGRPAEAISHRLIHNQDAPSEKGGQIHFEPINQGLATQVVCHTLNSFANPTQGQHREVQQKPAAPKTTPPRKGLVTFVVILTTRWYRANNSKGDLAC